MTKSEIIATLAKKTGVTKKQAQTVLEELVKLAYAEAAKSKEGFVIPGLGKLVKVKRKARVGRNPRTGEQIQIPAKTVLKFRIAKACKDAVLK